MDRKSHTRMFPGYTDAQLKGFIADETRTMAPETRAKMLTEIAARESGASVYRPTPQAGVGSKFQLPGSFTRG